MSEFWHLMSEFLYSMGEFQCLMGEFQCLIGEFQCLMGEYRNFMGESSFTNKNQNDNSPREVLWSIGKGSVLSKTLKVTRYQYSFRNIT
jgi:hypothetical protein